MVRIMVVVVVVVVFSLVMISSHNIISNVIPVTLLPRMKFTTVRHRGENPNVRTHKHHPDNGMDLFQFKILLYANSYLNSYFLLNK